MATKVGHLYTTGHTREWIGAFGFLLNAQQTERNRTGRKVHSSLVFFFFFSSKRRSDIESVHVKRVVKKKVDQEGRPASLLPFD
jgi:hypothetical protein